MKRNTRQNVNNNKKSSSPKPSPQTSSPNAKKTPSQSSAESPTTSSTTHSSPSTNNDEIYNIISQQQLDIDFLKKKIVSLEKTVYNLQSISHSLEGQLIVSKKVSELLRVQIDDQNQYSCRPYRYHTEWFR